MIRFQDKVASRERSHLLKVFDGHINISENGNWFNTGIDASYASAVDALEEAGIKRAALIAMPGVSTNKVFESSAINRSRYWCFGNIDFERIQYSLDQIKELELDGVKFHPRIQGVEPERIMESGVLDAIEGLGIPVMICGWQQSSTVSIESLSPLVIDKIAKRYKTVKFSLAHLGGHRFWDAFTVARSNPNVFLDCSYFLEFFKGTSLETDFFASLSLVDEKIIYGSDFPEINPKTYLSNFFKSDKEIDENILSKVFTKNLEKLMTRNSDES